MMKDVKAFVTGEGPKMRKERRDWSRAHTAEAVRLITEWLVSCKVQNMHSLEYWERETLQWTLTEMGFDIHTLIGDIFQQEIQSMLEYVGGEEQVEAISNGPMSRNQYFQWEAAGKVTTFHMCYDDYVHGISDYYKIQQCQKFLNGLRFLKSKNREMWKAQGELLRLKADLKKRIGRE